jgi:hypothetical protein
LTLYGLVQIFVFLNFVVSKIKPYYQKISTIQSKDVINALTNGCLWHAHKRVPGNQSDDEDDEQDSDRGEGGDDQADHGDGGGTRGGRSGRGRGRGRGGRGRDRGNGGLGKQPAPSDRKLRSHNATAPQETKVRRVNEDVTWKRTLSQWEQEAATATRYYGKPAPLTASSLSALPRIPKPHLGVGAEGEGMGHHLFFFFM